MYVLGISRVHDSAAALVRDGEIVAFAEEERFTRVKHDGRFPSRAIEFCLNHAGITLAEVDHVAFYWQRWREAVHAAKEQGPKIAERLDRALRRGFFGDSRNVSMRHEILEIAETVDGLDAAALAAALDDGRARAALAQDRSVAEGDEVKGSPHVFLPDGTSAHNPGIEMHWEGKHGEGFPVVDKDDPTVYEQLLTAAAHT